MSDHHLNLYSVYHLNLAYSSIEEEERARVIEKCYWPLLKLISKYSLPFGIEASGYTLEAVATIDHTWTEELRGLLNEGRCEFIGSGYAQIIGPLVPARVNDWNQRLGLDVYRKILGIRPSVALVSEMAYSSGIIEHYVNNGYEAIVMEWNNPRKHHPEWNNEWKYFAQKAIGPGGVTIPVLWTDSIVFQKFQRYAHGEIEIDQYCEYIESHLSGKNPRYLPMYANDVEIFDFRPGRYEAEAEIDDSGEWKRIEAAVNRLGGDSRIRFVKPSEVLAGSASGLGGNLIRLESSEEPVPVKKQEKYNINRWAITGRSDLEINTKCFAIYHRMAESATRDDWKELCYLWSSDFRTHITRRRWDGYLERLHDCLGKWDREEPSSQGENHKKSTTKKTSDGIFEIVESERKFIVETDSIRCILNKAKGCAVEGFWFKGVSPNPLFGTLPHGYYEDIALGADFYSGHLVVEKPGEHKTTDLVQCRPTVLLLSETSLSISIVIENRAMKYEKEIILDSFAPSLRIRAVIQLGSREFAIIHPMHITLIPSSFDADSLFFSTHNGGNCPESFKVGDNVIHHAQSLSSLI